MNDFVPPPVSSGTFKLESSAYKANPFYVVARLVTWSAALFSFALRMLLDRLLRRSSHVQDAVNLRKTLERLGPSAIKIGQQLSIRTDLIPKEYSDELMHLLDNVPPFPTEVARQLIERELRRPLNAIFRQFSDKPIGSASIACVYKAQLHTGEIVAVKVRRPEVVRVVVSDLAVVSLFFNLAEQMRFIRPGKSRPVVDEFRRMLLDELNFLVEARQTELFRQDADKNNKYVTAPEVYRSYSSAGVLVTEFIEGTFLRQILDAIERKDEAFLKSLESQGLSRQLMARRLINVFYWELFENSFFHADPHPSNVVLQPDGKVVLIDFGATGTITAKYRKDLMQFIRSLASEDIDGMVRNMINSLKPLPPLNLEAYTNEMYHAMREYLFTSRSKFSSWQERSSGRAMVALTEISRKYKIPMRADVLRYMRASFQFDSIIYRVNPDLDSRKEFRRYMRQRGNRLRKQTNRRFKEARRLGISASIQLLGGAIRDRLSDVDSVLSFLSDHTVQLESLFRRRVSARVRLLAWMLKLVRLAGSCAFLLVLWTWCRQHHPLWRICHFLDAALTFCFGVEVRTLPDQVPQLSQRLWFWVAFLLTVILFSLGSLIRNLLKPRSKVE